MTTPKPPPKRKRGRPTAYSPKLADMICRRLAGGEALLAICQSDNDMPGRQTVHMWCLKHPEFRDMIKVAREIGADTLAEQCLLIADSGSDVPRDTLKVTTRRWLASKIAPRRYGDRLTAEVSGPDGGPLEVRDLPSDLEIARMIARILLRAAPAVSDQNSANSAIVSEGDRRDTVGHGT